MTNGELIMQKAKQILAYCNSFTQDEVELSFLGEIDLEEESAKRAKEIVQKGMFGVEIEILKNLFCPSDLVLKDSYIGYLCTKNNISIVVNHDFDGGLFWFFNTGDYQKLDVLDKSYIVDNSDVIDRYKDDSTHLFFNKEGVFYLHHDMTEARFFK